MAINRERARQCLKVFDFRRLFVEELGWDKYSAGFPVSVGGTALTLKGTAEKRGVVAFVCDEIPDYASRLKVEKQVAKSHFEHFIIFTDKARGRQVWQWVRREPGRPLRAREHRYDTSQSGELLIQKLENIQVTLEQEETFTLSAVTYGLKAAFDVETVTKKFYERFKAEHERFLKFIEGIPDDHVESWYASVMMNRLMFLYFIQAKTFLDGNADYLRDKLAESKTRGGNRYYREFLCTLFFEGFAKKTEERAPSVNKLLGTVPYLNGGLFQRHQIEELHGKKIQIPDVAFDRLFSFFKEYQWHLDERPDRDDREINPDVLGYIFEKYINQKQMGAYYTKEDITEYISKNTIVPVLFDNAKKRCAIAFEPDGYVWRLVRENPDRYIYEPVRRGKDRALPSEISAGLQHVVKRDKWNQAAPYEDEPDNFLPTESWREAVERKRRYCDVHENLVSGKVAEINDFLTLNLDIRQFAEDVIQYSEGPELVRAFYKAISNVSVLDPTCGSGAFLFAALNVLKPLYEACLKRMSAFVEEWDAKPGKPAPEKFKDFREILAECRKHPNQDYFVLKSIIVNNLYGVDIMEEAIEICKLRLFLKLVAQVDTQDRIEPLPDIDFNIRSGNTLVGYAKYADVEKAVAGKFDFGGAMQKIEDKAAILDSAVEMFRAQQTHLDGVVTAEDKRCLRARFEELADELNDYLAGEYNQNTKAAISAWRDSHRPFHWFSEFHTTMMAGGFDAIIGNPPYVEYEEVVNTYTVPPDFYASRECNNLYAFSFERCVSLAKPDGRIGLIIPVSSVSTDGYLSLRRVLLSAGSFVVSNYNDRPGKLFDGLEHIRLSIFLQQKCPPASRRIFASSYNKWATEERPLLFPRLSFTDVTDAVSDVAIPKVGNQIEYEVLKRLIKVPRALGSYISRSGPSHIYLTRKLSHFVQILGFVPKIFDSKGKLREPSELKELCFGSKEYAYVALATLNSTLFYWWLSVLSDCRNLNKREILLFPLDLGTMHSTTRHELGGLADDLMADMRKNARLLEVNYKKHGTMKIECIYPRHSKPIIDKIDALLAKHYGFTDEQLDYIVNFDIKYRMGQEVGDD